MTPHRLYLAALALCSMNVTAADPAASSPGLMDRLGIELARAHQQAGRLDDAEAQLRPLHKRRQLGPMGHQLLGEIAGERGNWREAEMHYRAALAQSPDTPGLHLRLGQALMAQGQTKEADQVFERYRHVKAAEGL